MSIIQDSDNEPGEKITQIINIYEKNPNFEGKPSFKKWCNFCRRFGHSIAEYRQKQPDNLNRPPKPRQPSKPFYQHMKINKNYKKKCSK